MIGGENNNNKKPRLNGISLSIHNSKGTWYFGLLLAATLILLSLAISGEFSRASSKAYAEEEQIYKTQMLRKPMLLTSIDAGSVGFERKTFKIETQWN